MRLLPLRRPPVLRVATLPFLPPGDLRAAERRWSALCAANPAYFDGRLLHVLAVHRNGHGGATLDVAECAYRHWAVGLGAARAGSEHAGPPPDLGVRALGVKALVTCGEAVLLGRRSEHVAAYGGCWEFAPGGGLAPGRDPREMILEELAEETNLTPPAVTPVTARALLFDHRVRSWEIVFSIVLPASCGHDCASPSGEYSKLAWMEIRRLAALRDGGSAPGQSPQLALTPAAVALLPLLPLPCAEIRA